MYLHDQYHYLDGKGLEIRLPDLANLVLCPRRGSEGQGMEASLEVAHRQLSFPEQYDYELFVYLITACSDIMNNLVNGPIVNYISETCTVQSLG